MSGRDKNLGVLFAVFLEAVNGYKRTQWLIVPPANTTYGTPAGLNGRGRMIKRSRSYPEHRAKWSLGEAHGHGTMRSTVMLELGQYESAGWTVLPPVVIALDHDDYLKVWKGEASFSTPYKAFRHVDKQLDLMKRDLVS